MGLHLVAHHPTLKARLLMLSCDSETWWAVLFSIYMFELLFLLILPSHLTLALVKSKDSGLVVIGGYSERRRLMVAYPVQCTSPTNFSHCCRFSFHSWFKFGCYLELLWGGFYWQLREKAARVVVVHLWPLPPPPPRPKFSSSCCWSSFHSWSKFSRYWQ